MRKSYSLAVIMLLVSCGVLNGASRDINMSGGVFGSGNCTRALQEEDIVAFIKNGKVYDKEGRQIYPQTRVSSLTLEDLGLDPEFVESAIDVVVYKSDHKKICL